jgi:uncharacterized protein (TIGR02594 family)
MRKPNLSDPPWLRLALAEVGTREAPGPANNARVMAYYRDAGHAWVAGDDVAWCAAFVGAMLARAGEKHTGSLAARSYLKFWKPTKDPKRGDIVVFSRGNSWQGHVAFYLRSNRSYIEVVGGNQADAVTIATYPRAKVLSFRTP